jgi:hypothetical protein
MVVSKVKLSGGTANLKLSFATRGNHTIKAVYSGANVFAGSSQSLIEEVL